MSVSGRAAAPYPPIITGFDGSTTNLRPTSVVNLDPIVVTWKKRDRLKTTISFPSGPDEAVEEGTEYVVRCGPPGYTEEHILGDHTATSGEFNYSFSGLNPTEIFARRDGYESSLYKFTTNVLNAAGGSAIGDIGTVNRTGIPVPHYQIIWEGKIGTVKVTPVLPLPSFPGNAFGDLKTVSLSTVDGYATGENIYGRSWFGIGSNAAVGGGTTYATAGFGGMSTLTESGTESRVRSYWMEGRITNPTLFISANTRSSSFTANLRKNGVTMGSIVVPAGATGAFYGFFAVDVSEGDSITWQFVGGGSGTATVKAATVEFDNSDGNARSLWIRNDAYGIGFATGTRYMPVCGGIGSFASLGSTEPSAAASVPIQVGSTAKKFGISIYANTYTTNLTVTLRKNGADTPVTVVVPAGQTGLFINTVDEVDLVAGDYLTAKLSLPSGSGSGTIVAVQVWIESDDDRFQIFNSYSDQALNYNVDLYRALIGETSPSSAAETAQRLTVSRPYAATLLTTINPLNNSASKTDYFMVNGVDSAMSLAISGNGRVTDTSHTVILQGQDQIDYHWGQQTNSMQFGPVSLVLKPLTEATNGYVTTVGIPAVISSAPEASVEITYVGDGTLRATEEYIEVINDGDGTGNLRATEVYIEVINDGDGTGNLRATEVYIEVIRDQ